MTCRAQHKNQLFLIEEYIKDKPEYLKYLTNPSICDNGLKLIFRSDCMANLLLWYLMGATEGVRNEAVRYEEIQSMFCRWNARAQETGSFIMPYAEDAEYIGSSAYFYVKQFNQARFFEEEGMEAVLSDFVRCFQRKLLFPDQKRLILKEYPENAGELLKKAGFIREMQDYVLYR